MNLHGEVMEAEVSFHSRLAYMTAYAGLHAHPDADLTKAMKRTNELHMNAFYSIPYYGKMVKSGSEDAVTEDMKAMAERYKKIFKKDKDKVKK